MKIIFTAFVLVCVLGSMTANAEATWGYGEDNGPSTWPENYPICGEKSQSPIAIQSADTVVDNSYGQFYRSLFSGVPSSMKIKNTGHAIQVDLVDGYVIDNPALLPGVFKAGQYHIHWAGANQRGSEHTLNDKQYFGELHIVHYNTKYNSIADAASHDDGLAVLGFFIEDDYPQDNLDFNWILGPIEKGSVNASDEFVTLEPRFSVEAILPADFDIYFRYKGSLTTPPCFESVVWTVFDTPLHISRRQAQVLETEVFSSGVQMINGNYRPPQPLNGRVVSRSPGCAGGAGFVRFSLLSIFLMVIFAFFVLH